MTMDQTSSSYLKMLYFQITETATFSLVIYDVAIGPIGLQCFEVKVLYVF